MNDQGEERVPTIVRRYANPNLTDACIVEFVVPMPSGLAASEFNTIDEAHAAMQNLITLLYAMYYNGLSVYELQQRILNSVTD